MRRVAGVLEDSGWRCPPDEPRACGAGVRRAGTRLIRRSSDAAGRGRARLGLTTTTPFTTPSAPCQGNYPRGQTWSYNAGVYGGAGYNVYTPPARPAFWDGPGHER